MIVRIMIGLLFLWSHFALGFDEAKCGDLFPMMGGGHPPWLGPFYVTTMIPSTASYLSSTGNCSLYGIQKRKRIEFIAHNKNHLEKDIAVGAGEYLSALAKLCGCSDKKLAQYFQIIHGYRKQILSSFATQNPLFVEEQISGYVAAEPLLVSCKL